MTVREVILARSASQPWRLGRYVAWVPGFARDFGFVVGVLLVYFVVRGQAPAPEGFAVTVTEWLVQLERDTHTFWEPRVQEISIQWHAVQEVANFVYAYLHFPVLIVVGTWLWFRGRQRFLFMRNVMFISMVFGLLFYYLVPAAPPRLLALHGYDLGFTDTVFGGNTAVTYAQPSLILNNYAAVPSFHFGWIALASAAIWVNSGNWLLRAVGVLLSVVMSWAIVASANHLFVDMALGGAIVGFSWWLARMAERRRASSRPNVASANEPSAS
ncbi:MAG: phosphatase PAP2 family protein [Dehalococcoidia bacterium]|nr:phosphatase PAP2 family protein [Dehalococcoidia bacterium]